MNFKENHPEEAGNATMPDSASDPSRKFSAAEPPADAGDDHFSSPPTEKEKVVAGIPIKMPHVTLRTVFMAILVAMGGFIFGYDTGQISGFLEMAVFLERFGEPGGPSTPGNPRGYHFTNVRSGLIVGLVSYSEI